MPYTSQSELNKGDFIVCRSSSSLQFDDQQVARVTVTLHEHVIDTLLNPGTPKYSKGTSTDYVASASMRTLTELPKMEILVSPVEI
jgi:hypothetical protein